MTDPFPPVYPASFSGRPPTGKWCQVLIEEWVVANTLRQAVFDHLAPSLRGQTEQAIDARDMADYVAQCHRAMSAEVQLVALTETHLTPEQLAGLFYEMTGNPSVGAELVDAAARRMIPPEMMSLIEERAARLAAALAEELATRDGDYQPCGARSGWHDDGDPMNCTRPEGHDGDHADKRHGVTWEQGTMPGLNLFEGDTPDLVRVGDVQSGNPDAT